MIAGNACSALTSDMGTLTTEAKSEMADNLVTWRDSQGLEMRGVLLRLTRYAAAIEIYTPAIVVRMSDVLHDFRITVGGRTVYSGPALVSNLLNAGTVLVCEVKLEDSGLNLGLLNSSTSTGVAVRNGFKTFLDGWQKFYHVRPEFKEVIGDIQSFLSDLKIWLDQVELEIRASPSADRSHQEREVIDEIGGQIANVIDTFIDRFEAIAAAIAHESESVHRAYLRRQLHPLLLCSPFAHRAFYKPLGYAGDYEVVDMMLRPPYEGSSLFSKMINFWLLRQAPAKAHRNRVDYLFTKLLQEAARLRSLGRRARVFNLGCGPAAEVQRLLIEQPVSDAMEFTLLDFNEQTLAHLRTTVESLKRAHGRSTPILITKRSVQQVLKEGGRSLAHTSENQYDFVYCAGLFDYLSDPICRRLLSVLYDMLAPNGLLLATNVSDVMNQSHPFRYSMEYILDWHLIYRTGPQLNNLAPERATRDCSRISSEDSGVNIFIEVRKPSHA